MLDLRRYQTWRKQKDKAQSKVTYELRVGRLKRGKRCEKCGWKPPSYTPPHGGLHAHHDDYSKPLEVRWLCSRCHRKWHGIHGDIRHVAPGKRVSGPRFIDVFTEITGIKVVKGLVEKSGATAR